MPSVCAQGCQYVANMTVYYAAHLDVCMMHIGTVLTCAAGRGVCVCVFVCVCVCVCMCVCTHACMHVCVCMCMCVCLCV